MTLLRPLRPATPRPLAALAALTILTATAATAQAQPMSSGSGAGTGTGMMGGASRNSTGTGMMGGGPGSSTGTGYESGGGLNLPGANRYDPFPPGPPPRYSPNRPVPYGPGADVTFPDDYAPVIPLDVLGGLEGGTKMTDLARVTELQLEYAKHIPAAGDRSLALSRIANAAMFSTQLDLAEKALDDSSKAALEMTPGMVQDQRLISIITAFLRLVEDRLRENLNEPITATGAGAAPAALPKVDRVDMIRRALADARRAADLAQRITNPTYRAQEMARVAGSLATGSQKVVSDYPPDESVGKEKDASGLVKSYQGLPDQMLLDATAIAERVERPVWRDQALVSVASSAAESKQFARSLAVARQIPLPEVRVNALVKIADIQARRGDPGGATATYHEAAEAVATIVEPDLRTVLAGVLIDNLISDGRFEDARKSAVLYPDEPNRVIALGAIAESQGRRGAGKSALEWINAEVPGRYRSWLYRKVNNGVVAAIEERRGNEITNMNRQP